MNCQQFLDELEGLPVEVNGETTLESVRASLVGAARQHAGECANCRESLEEFAETRRMLRRLAQPAPEAGPWFVKRVMGAIAAKENELDERRTGVWTSVRRLAPRLAAVGAVLLMLGGSWAYEQNQAEKMRLEQTKPAEGLFGAPSSSPNSNDDVIASVRVDEARP